MIHKFIDNGSDKTLVLFHGTGGDETVLLPVAKMVAPTMNHLSIRGDVVTFGKRRFSAVQNETQILDEGDLLGRTETILNVVKDLQAQYNLGELWALGFSNGANTIAALILEHQTPFKKCILLRPMNFTSDTKECDLNHMDILIHSGRFDDIIPYESAVALEKRLMNNNAQVTHRIYELDHRMRAYEIEEIKQWFDMELK